MLNSHPRRPLLAAFLVFLLACIAAATLIWHLEQRERQEWRARVANLAAARADAIQRIVERGLSASYALAALVRQGRGAVPNFDAVAGEMLPFYPAVSELALAPGGVIRNVVPLAGNEKALGHDLLQDPEQKRDALHAKDTGKPILAGPLELVQGGMGVVGRFPIFLDDAGGKPVFWGFALVVMRLPGALDSVDLPQLAQRGYAYALWRVQPDTGQKQIIAASSNAALVAPVERHLQVPNATWTLSVAPLAGWGNPLRLALEAAVGLLFSLLLAYLAKLLLELRSHREGLEALVAQRTAELRAREADLNHAQSIARVGNWSLDLATNAMHGSPEAYRILGASELRPISYRTYLDLVHPDDRQAVDLATRAALKGKPYDIEYRVLAGEAVRWVHIKAEMAFGADGRLSSALGTIQDVTERKLAEETLRASESRYRELFEANPHPMWVWDVQSLMFLAVNDAAVAHYGYSRAEFLAMMITEIRLPEDVPRLLRRVALVQKQSDRHAGIWRHRRKDGSLIDVEIVSHTLVFDGRRAQMALANDITERLQAERELRASEARFRSLTEMSSDFYWETDAEHRLTQLSPGGKASGVPVFGQGVQLGHRRWEMPYLSPDEAGWQAHRAVLDARRPFRNFELSRLGADGSERHIVVSGDPVFDASGAFQGYRGVGTDITERKAAEAKIARLSQIYAALSQCNQAIVRSANAKELFPQICRDAVQFGGMKSARIGLVDAQTRTLRVAASFGFGADELENLEISLDADNPYGRGPTGTAVRENRPVWCQDFMNDPATAPWHERGARLGWGAVAALPLRRNGAVVGAFILFDGEVGAFDEARRRLLLEMAEDISYALDNFERESRRKQAEADLRASEARFRSLTEMSSDFYWESDAEHRLTQRSSGSRGNALLELKYDDWLGRHRWEIPYLAPDESGWQAHRAVLDAHQPFRKFEFARAGSDGDTRYFLIHGDPVFDASGAFQGYRGVGTDITERKRAERALTESEARFRSLTEMSSDFYWESDAEHRLRARASANRKLSTVSVFERGAQIGERRWEIPYLTPDEAGWEAHRAVLDAHRPFRNFELSRLGTDGTERHISISGDPVFDASGAFQGYRGVGTDITERKQAESALKENEQRLRLALNSAAMAAWEWNVRPDTLNWSEHPAWLIGPEPAAGYPDFRELVHPQDRAGFLQAGQQAVAQGTHYYAVFRIVRTDGALRWIEAQGVFLEAAGSGRRERVIGVSRDITASKLRQDELRRLNEELEQRVAERTSALESANNELEAFSYSVSHDLRAPLRTILGFNRLVLDQYAGQIDEQGRDMLRRVGAGAQKMGLLIDDLLKLSRISRQEMRIERVELSALAREAADELQAAEPQRRVEWVIARQVSAEGDPGLIWVVLQNLIGNAWKYSSRREVARIEFGAAEQDGKQVYFVRDNGAGFDMAQASKLFGAFQRLHTDAEFPGSGIGLATVARILQRHGGKAWAEGRVGEGATFYFSLG